MAGSQPVQRLQPVKKGDLQSALRLTDLRNIVKIHPGGVGGLPLGREHQFDGIGDGAEGQLPVAVLGGGEGVAVSHGVLHRSQIGFGDGGLQKGQGFLAAGGGPKAPFGCQPGIAGEGKPVAKQFLVGVQIGWKFLHIETTPFTNTAKTGVFCI